MNGATRPFVITKPLSKPQQAPASTAIPIGTITGYCSACAKLAAATPVNATSEPSERSTPPVSKTYVTPTARIPLIEICRIRLTRFATVRKFGRASDNATKISTSAATRPSFPYSDFVLANGICVPHSGMAWCKISSGVVWRGLNSAETTPSRITRMRSLSARISFNSEETIRIAIPSRASRAMRA